MFFGRTIGSILSWHQEAASMAELAGAGWQSQSWRYTRRGDGRGWFLFLALLLAFTILQLTLFFSVASPEILS
jgi:hypothetical protein